jgi:sulfur relay (sulfurtransferase) DsrF/TusC family protein
MRKLFLGFTLFFALESKAGDPNGLPEPAKGALDVFAKMSVFVAVAGVALVSYGAYKVIDGAISDDDLETADFTNYSKNYYYDIEANAIIFTENSNLENFEILLSRDTEINFSSTQYFDNNLFKSDELYVGFKYRF